MLPLLLTIQQTGSQFSSDDKQQNENITAKPEKKTKPALTLEEVRAVLADKSRAGHTAEIRELLKKYGASKTRRPETL